jgi:two-component system, sensor histidine kinase and response regulator
MNNQLNFCKYLIIDDSKYFRRITKLILTKNQENIEIFEAENGKIGVQLALKHLPDLVICDIMMPELDGYGVLKALREHPTTQGIPFIFLSSRAEKADQRHGMELGADDYLTKPFTKEELLGAIAARLNKYELFYRQSQKELDELRDNLTHSLPHELHTPLTGILGLSRVILDVYNVEDPRVVEMIQMIHNSAQGLYRLTQNFLLYADLEMLSNDPEQLKAMNTFQELTFTEEIITRVATKKSEEYHREADLQLTINQDKMIKISAPKIEKILEEILDNAFKFSQPGTVIQIQTHVDDVFWKIDVMDYGKGMSPSEIQRIGAYVQFQRKLYEQQGSGLGLIIAKRLTELYGGQLTISSIPNQQTMVRISLPWK